MKLVLLLSFIFFFGFAQSTKPEYFIDENNQIISVGQFKEKIHSKKYQIHSVENDSAQIVKLFNQERIGSMTAEKRNSIIEALYDITNSKIGKNQTIIINFYYFKPTDGKSSGINYYIKDKSFIRQAKRKGIAQFFITEKGFKRHENTFEDINDQIRSLLFPENFAYEYIIIKADGAFILRLGEYPQDQILTNLSKLN